MEIVGIMFKSCILYSKSYIYEKWWSLPPHFNNFILWDYPIPPTRVVIALESYRWYLSKQGRQGCSIFAKVVGGCEAGQSSSMCGAVELDLITRLPLATVAMLRGYLACADTIIPDIEKSTSQNFVTKMSRSCGKFTPICLSNRRSGWLGRLPFSETSPCFWLVAQNLVESVKSSPEVVFKVTVYYSL